MSNLVNLTKLRTSVLHSIPLQRFSKCENHDDEQNAETVKIIAGISFIQNEFHFCVYVCYESEEYVDKFKFI